MPEHSGAFPFTLGVWLVMTWIMMLPAVTPWVAVMGRVAGTSATRAGAEFLGGYFLAWVPYAVAGALVHGALVGSGVTGHAPLGGIMGGLILIGAGAFQFTGLKAACLRHCRSPLGFFLERWDDGPARSWALGLRHGWFCVGCCWALMATMFAVGVTHLGWMVVLAGVLWYEQVASRGALVSRLIGWMLMGWGSVLIVLAVR